MKLRLATTLILFSSAFITFQNCAPTMPTDDGLSDGSLESSSIGNPSTFTGNGSTSIPLGGSNDNSTIYNPGGTVSPPSTTPPSTSTLPVAGEGRIAIYRVYNHINGDHLFTKNKAEADALDLTQEWETEGIAFVLFANRGNNRKPIYRCYNPIAGQHYVSHDPNCEAQGMSQEDLLGYANLSLAETSSAALYRCIAVQPPLRFLATINGTECGAASMRVDYQYGFVMPPSMAP